MPFCDRCGKRLQEGEVCNCDSNVNPAANYSAGNQFSAYAESTYQKGENFFKKNLKWIIVAGVAVVAIVALILIICGGSAPYEEPIDEILTEINKGKEADLFDLTLAGLPDELKDICKEVINVTVDEDDISDARDEMRDAFADLTAEYKNWEVDFEYSDEDITELDEDEIYDKITKLYKNYYKKYIKDEIDSFEKEMDDDDILEEELEYLDSDISLEDYKDLRKRCCEYLKTFKDPEITDAYKVRGRFVVRNNGNQVDKTDNESFYVIKINGEWVMSHASGCDSESEIDDKVFYFDSDECDFLENYINQFLPRCLNRI